MKKLNILDLHRMIHEKNMRSTACFDKILDICHKKIIQHAKQREYTCFFEVPEYIFGFPLYDLNTCIAYVMNSLKENGFLATYFFPKFIYISWDLQEIEKSKQSNKVQPETKPTNMLDFKYKPSGKLSLQF